MSSPCASTQASASWPALQPRAGGEGLHFRGQLEVPGEVLALEARAVAAVVVLGEVLGPGDRAGEKAAAERAVGDEADAQAPAGGEHAGLGVARPERILALQGGDRVDAAGALEGRRGRLGKAEEADLAGADEVGHRPDRVLDRRRRIDAMLVVQVDRLDAQAPQARLGGALDVGRAAVEAAHERVRRIAHDAELGREEDAAAAARGSPGRSAPRWRAVRRRRRCRGRSRRDRGRGAGSRSTRPRRGWNRSRSCPCSRGRWRRRSGRGRRAGGSSCRSFRGAGSGFRRYRGRPAPLQSSRGHPDPDMTIVDAKPALAGRARRRRPRRAAARPAVDEPGRALSRSGATRRRDARAAPPAARDRPARHAWPARATG